MKKYTESEFVYKIRDKYPDAYDDLSDDELLKIWLRKYPNDEDLINFSQGEKLNYDEFNSKIKSNTFSYWYLLIILFVIAFFTNPDTPSHQEEINNTLKAYLERVINNSIGDSDNEWSELGQVFGKYLGNTALDEIVKSSVSSDNYYFFSLTRLDFFGKQNIIGVGVFGGIYVFPEFERELDSTYNKIFNNTNDESNEYKSDSLDSENSEDLGYYETSSTTNDNSNSSYNQNSQQETCYKCKGTGKCGKCDDVFRKSYYKGNGSYENRNESLPGYIMCSDCYGRGHKQFKRIEGGWEPGEDCYVSKCENGWVFCNECNSYGNGEFLGQCKECKGTGHSN